MYSLVKQYVPSSFLFFLIILTATTIVANARDITVQNRLNTSITAIFIFGDSTVDSGNNNYIKTLFRGNFPPYGVDFPDHTPTGRFTDGLLVTDYIASYCGVKQVIPPYLDPKLSLEDLITGVSFASAGSGYDPSTSVKNSVIDLSKQLEYFDEYKKRLEQMIGKKRVEDIVKNAAYIVSAGTNDIIYTLGVMESHLVTLTAPTYMQFLLSQCKWFVQALKERGPRKIGVVGVPPVGCLPIAITTHSLLNEPRRCVDSLSSVARDFNQMLQTELKAMQDAQTDDLVAYGDIYGPLSDQINHPQKYGFEVSDKGCCGSGTMEAGFACNKLTHMCNDVSKHVFWDSIHPTQRSYHFLFEALRPIVDEFLHHK